jgi:pyrimidine deaminase RibD-like protein
MRAVVGWRLEPCDHTAVCVEFVTEDDVYRVLLGMQDEGVAALALRRVLGEPLPATAA